ncbi:MAG: flavin-containing monooxygenase [Gammaproteobacteria bacterium]
MQYVDVIIVGAGLSGIGAARQLQDKCPDKSFAILEGRDCVGGTWDLFRYPGIRSDSDMYTMGYDSKPWKEAKAIADGPSILDYVRQASAERGLDDKIHFRHQVKSADWSSENGRWTVQAEHDGKEISFSCNMLFMCSGYYSYESGYKPEIQGLDSFSGPVIHPQEWPENLDYSGKRVVIIGSGATAMTLVPSMAGTAEKVTMLQRSPTYVVSMPAEDAIANFLKKVLPAQWAYQLIRAKNIWFQRYFYGQTRTRPDKVREKLLGWVRKALGPDFDVDKHFTPDYKPWDQRMCLVPDGDLFRAIRSGKADVVTDTIEQVSETGITLTSGQKLEADIIVTATGLNLVVLGGAEFSVDGEPVSFPDTYSYKGMMFSGVPNLVYTLGYINASWTLRSELVAEYVCRLVNHMAAVGADACTPRLRDEDKDMESYMLIDDFSPGYMRRAMHLFPRQGNRDPWRNTQNYLLDKKLIRNAAVEDGVLAFEKAVKSSSDSSTENAGGVQTRSAA